MTPGDATPSKPGLARVALALVRRLDTLVAAGLLTAGLGIDPARRLCTEMGCTSGKDSALLAGLLAASAVAMAAFLWQVCRRWWTRAAMLIAAPYIAIQLPTWLGHFGKWEVSGATGQTCVVRFGMREDQVRAACGAPAARCEGPKYFEPGSAWNPLELSACGFDGVTYGNRLAVFSCRGSVERVVILRDGRHQVGCAIRDLRERRRDGETPPTHGNIGPCSTTRFPRVTPVARNTALALDVSTLDAAAFASGAFVNLTASCNAAAPSEKGSLLSQFASKVDDKSRIRGVRGTVDFGTEPADTEGELVKEGKDRSKTSWWNFFWAPSSHVVERKGGAR